MKGANATLFEIPVGASYPYRGARNDDHDAFGVELRCYGRSVVYDGAIQPVVGTTLEQKAVLREAAEQTATFEGRLGDLRHQALREQARREQLKAAAELEQKCPTDDPPPGNLIQRCLIDSTGVKPVVLTPVRKPASSLPPYRIDPSATPLRKPAAKRQASCSKPEPPEPPAAKRIKPLQLPEPPGLPAAQLLPVVSPPARAFPPPAVVSPPALPWPPEKHHAGASRNALNWTSGTSVAQSIWKYMCDFFADRTEAAHTEGSLFDEA